ncbi:Hypoxanthine-guanine phosphoribosyltransferase [[Mycoplasma] cavipharyngis]|uniref:hypoxanthine phosphoribosyltransferase n=1 Tax=[Mycoplasma] cavipharyngis TaxID=92757 RepID=UPI00370447FE
MDHRIQRILITTEELKTGIKKAADYINKTYQNCQQPPILVGILKGCIPFIGQLLPNIKIDVEVDFLTVSSYEGGLKSTENVRIVTDLVTDIANRDVILIEDIVDTGRTINIIKQIILSRKAKSMQIVAMLDKPCQRVCDLKVDFACFTIEPLFVVGFGLDYKQILRNLPYIAILKPEIYQK